MLQELLMFLIIPTALYVMIWFSAYTSYRAEIRRINESLERRRSGKEYDAYPTITVRRDVATVRHDADMNPEI